VRVINPEPGTQNVVMRNRLAELLAAAAQVEHDVLCQYLFAAATIKQHHAEGGVSYAQLEQMRGWKSTIMEVARQEMEHLGIVTNLLTAIGEAPRFDRPDFPARASILPIDGPSRLVRFSDRATLRFVCFEMPPSPPAKDLAYLRKRIPGFSPGNYDAIYKLYGEVKTLLGEIEADDLFIGPPSAQFVSGGNAVAARGVTLPGNAAEPVSMYDVMLPAITDTKTALDAVDQIIEEGEGGDASTPTSHFARFLTIDEQLVKMLAADPAFEPARQVVADPRSSSAAGGTTITNPATAQVSELFDLGYGVMIQLLMRMFAHSGESAQDVAALESIAFFPLMTTVIRPLSEVLTQLPAFSPETPDRAGPSYAFPRRLALLPHRKAAWRNLAMQLALLDEQAGAVAADARNPQALRPRLQLVAEQVARIRYTFENAMAMEVDP
jgi:hypothetical protein